MLQHSRKINDIDIIVSELNNYLETHAYLFEGEFYGDSSEIVSHYGFGYTDGDERIFHWIEKGDIEVCSLTKDELRVIIEKGLTNESIIMIMDKCS